MQPLMIETKYSTPCRSRVARHHLCPRTTTVVSRCVFCDCKLCECSASRNEDYDVLCVPCAGSGLRRGFYTLLRNLAGLLKRRP